MKQPFVKILPLSFSSIGGKIIKGDTKSVLRPEGALGVPSPVIIFIGTL